jgi:uncharacterized membrane protein
VTVASLTARGGVRQHLLWVALALSVALNLCFVAGALWIRVNEPPLPASPHERLQRIGAELALSPQQKVEFDEYSQAVQERMRKMHEAVEPLVGNAWSELAKPDADAAKVTQLFDEAAQQRYGYRRELTLKTLSFLSTLSPEQRKRFVALARQRPWDKRQQHAAP